MQNSHFENSGDAESLESAQNEEAKIKIENQIQDSYNRKNYTSFYMFIFLS